MSLPCGVYDGFADAVGVCHFMAIVNANDALHVLLPYFYSADLRLNELITTIGIVITEVLVGVSIYIIPLLSIGK